MRAPVVCVGLLWLLLARLAVADPGAEVARGDAGWVRWYVYAESPGLVLGEGALGVLLEAPGGGVRLEPKLELELRAPDGSTQTRVSRWGFADNGLLQGAPFFFHQTGIWTLQMRPIDSGADREFRTNLEVLEGSGIWRRAWPWLVLPLVVFGVVWLTRSPRPAAGKLSRRNPEP